MLKLSFQNRIALIYIISTAILIGVTLSVVFAVVKYKTYSNRHTILKESRDYYSQKVKVDNDNLLTIINDSTISPKAIRDCFIEIVDLNGNSVYRSENLGTYRLYNGKEKKDIVNIGDAFVLYVQTPLILNNKTEGYMLVGVEIDEQDEAVHKLGHAILISYPISLIILFLIAQLVAKNSIKPINNIIQTSNAITHENLSTRVPLPANKDELYELSDTINNLLGRIENAFEREKNFTSYASHEFRTPLAVMKGTMEVLIRKTRTEAEYHEKIFFCINEVDKLNSLVEELLLLTRYENQRHSIKYDNVLFEDILMVSLGTFSEEIKSKKIDIKTIFDSKNATIKTDEYLLSIILKNLLSNAVKYSFEKSVLEIQTYVRENCFFCEIRNQGANIPEKELPIVFDKFYRSQSIDKLESNGFGLGLSIVKHFCELLGIGVQLENKNDNIIQARLLIPLSAPHN